MKSGSTARSKLVYTTATGRSCPRCGFPESACRCGPAAPVDQPIPDKIVARLRLEKAGRGGKTVTVVADLPRHRDFLKTLAGELKRLCGSGGTVADTSVEIQGDHLDTLRTYLQGKGWRVKG